MTRVTRRGALLAAGVWLVVVGPAGAADTGEVADAVAVVAALHGRATVKPAGQAARDVALFDWLPRGAVVETGPGARILLAFATGQRSELGPGARATLAVDGLANVAGPVTTLAAIPPLPRLAAVAPGAIPTTTAGVVRIRGTRIAGLYPRAGTRVLAERAALRFEPVPGVARYRVDVENESGASVFRGESSGEPVLIPPGTLEPSTQYYWRVRGVPAVGAVPRGDEQFETLAAPQAAARRVLGEALGASADADSLALLSAVDRRLGLLFEAREELKAAVALTPGHPGLLEALAGLDNEMGGR